jgi:hypothetical protein
MHLATYSISWALHLILMLWLDHKCINEALVALNSIGCVFCTWMDEQAE